MYVCICNSIKEKQLRAVIQDTDHASPTKLMKEMCGGFVCGLCRDEVEDIMEEEGCGGCAQRCLRKEPLLPTQEGLPIAAE